jgi:hypothetical protein
MDTDFPYTSQNNPSKCYNILYQAQKSSKASDLKIKPKVLTADFKVVHYLILVSSLISSATSFQSFYYGFTFIS